MPSFRSSGGGGGYDYVQDGEPTEAVEGEEWYDPGADAAFVYDGSGWVEQTVTDHGQLSGVSAADHHSRPSAGSGLTEDANGNFNFTDHSRPSGTNSYSETLSKQEWSYDGYGDETVTVSVNMMACMARVYFTSNSDANDQSVGTAVDINYANAPEVRVPTTKNNGNVVATFATANVAEVTYRVNEADNADNWSTNLEVYQPAMVGHSHNIPE
jgi:hypothetical protein